MDTIIEFRNFKQTCSYISADLFISGNFIVRFSDNLKHALETQSTNLKIYDYFRQAVILYINRCDDCEISMNQLQ